MRGGTGAQEMNNGGDRRCTTGEHEMNNRGTTEALHRTENTQYHIFSCSIPEKTAHGRNWEITLTGECVRGLKYDMQTDSCTDI